MIISKTPFRVSLFGGSTDYQSYYSLYGALIIGFAISQYCYISVREMPKVIGDKTKLYYSRIEEIEKISDIKNNGIRGCFEHLNMSKTIEMFHLSDLPAQTGIGSSSSFVTGLLNALNKLENRSIDKKQLALDAIHVERNILKEPGGIQDQIWAAYGGFNSIHIDQDGSFKVKPMPIDPDFIKEFFSRAFMIYTGKTRQSFQLAADHDKVTDSKKKIHSLAKEAYNVFEKGGISEIGILLHESWMNKKSITQHISNNEIDNLYVSLQNDGMIGGKLLGSGGSGFIFGILRDETMQQKIKDKYSKYYIECNPSFTGSEIING